MSPTRAGSGAPLAWLGARRQLSVRDSAGRRDLTYGPASDQVLWGSWKGRGATGESGCSWPTWAPDGRRIAAYRLPDPDHAAPRLTVFDTDGVAEVDLFALPGRLPIYLQWSPDGHRLAVLTQSDEELELSSTRADVAGAERRVAHGVPLFCCWASPDRIAAYVGSTASPGSARIALYDPQGRVCEVLPGTPGNFCVPVPLGDEILYVIQDGSFGRIVVARPGDAEAREIERVEGLVALLPSPDGRHVARAVARGGDGTPYEDLALIDVVSGSVRPLHAGRCLAFLFAPTGDRLVVARVDTERNLLEWVVTDLTGDVRPVAATYPTRDLGFYLRFFEQYAQSHPIVDPTGRWLLVAGKLEGHDPDGDTPDVWEVPLDGGEPDRVGDGLFGVYGHAPTAGG